MTKNLKKDYIKKLIGITTKNGYKIDISNYIYNPSYDNQYPSLIKTVSEDEHEKVISRVYYFKYYNGNGEYITETYNLPKGDNNTWVFIRKKKENVIESSNRFNLNHLIELTEAI